MYTCICRYVVFSRLWFYHFRLLSTNCNIECLFGFFSFFLLFLPVPIEVIAIFSHPQHISNICMHDNCFIFYICVRILALVASADVR